MSGHGSRFGAGAFGRTGGRSGRRSVVLVVFHLVEAVEQRLLALVELELHLALVVVLVQVDGSVPVGVDVPVLLFGDRKSVV